MGSALRSLRKRCSFLVPMAAPAEAPADLEGAKESAPSDKPASGAAAADTRMILKVSGEYDLDDLQGTYTFDKASCMLSAKDEGSDAAISIGPFIFGPIQDKPLPEVEGYEKLRQLCASSTEFICNSEIMAEIQKDTNDGALFVLPSQLNGAEYPSHSSVVTRVVDYKYDNTGGPRGQLACHPAAAQFVLDNAAHEKRKEGINAVDVLEAEPRCGCRLHNGYLEVKAVPDPQKAAEFFKAQLHSLRPLIMEDIPATGLKPNKRSLNAGTHRVGLVYASAVPVNTYLNRATSQEHVTHQNAIAELVLKAQYYGALKHAATHPERPADAKPRKVYLMPLGGGVFNNSWDLIARSMATAIEMLTEDELKRVEIHPLTWSGSAKEKNMLETHFGELLSK